MRLRHKLVLGVIAAAVPTYAFARMVRVDEGPPTFALAGPALGGDRPAPPAAAYLTGSRIATVGEDALAIDADSGALVLVDRTGKLRAQLAIARDAGLLAYDPGAKLAYVVDRAGDKVHVVAVGAQLETRRTFATPAEPYGIALTPDRQTVLVTTIADRTLVALDAATGAERWRTPLGREPRGIAVSPDGKRALVTSLATGSVEEIDLARHRGEHIAITTPAVRCRRCTPGGTSFARGSFTATFVGNALAIVPFQRETPVQQADGNERTSSYGGGADAPVTHHLAFVGFGKDIPDQISAQVMTHQPRAIAWDGARDLLYVAGMGNDTVLQLQHASQRTITEGMTTPLLDGTKACGADGIAIAGSGDVVVWCSFTRSVMRLHPVDRKRALAADNLAREAGPSVVASRMSVAEHQGFVLFHHADATISQQGAMACASCHPDGRADGLSWRIEKHELQTPLLAGRLVGTHPYKWDGGDKDLTTSLTMTMKRLGGGGLDAKQTAALEAYVSALPAVRTPGREPARVARGKALFDSAELGCRTCHDGKAYTDGSKHKLTSSLPETDTPSLLGLAASAPYYHDGSAATLEALLRDRAAVHGMAETSHLRDDQIADLTAFLETL
ncbi:MAG TPA: PQQ-binding-like beta-propeller repeat protein [Kofleriaceae bacterium]|nr:PQQ-binding-like beta-propeller repeat protein [Kofleriaceae bacterium]